MKRITVGLDLAKNRFHLVGVDAHGQQQFRKSLRRTQVAAWFSGHGPFRVAMEACSGAHYWARTLQDQGHHVRLIAPQHVKAYQRRQKNDFNDAAAIAEASSRAGLRGIAVKSAAQLDLQAVLRMRRRVLNERTALSNQLRGLLAEHGIVMPRSLAVLRRRIPELLEAVDNGLSARFRRLLQHGVRRLRQLDDDYRHLDQELRRAVAEDATCQRLLTAPGIGPVTAAALAVVLGDGRSFGRGRDVAAAIGLVPRQYSTGGKPKLLGISKCGDRALRASLIQGARAVLYRARGKDDPLSRWALKVCAERGFNKATVAVANKLARISWVLVRHQTTYQPNHRLRVSD